MSISLRQWAYVIGFLLLAGMVSGCADSRYYWQSVRGHVQLMQAAQPIDTWLAQDQTPLPLRHRLVLAQGIRRFSVTDLHLPDNASYQRFADLKRRYAVWNVAAAPALSLTLKTWCFPVAGCVGYRGYFDEADAQALGTELRAQGLEVSVYGVPAYSTLGWLNWAGGDPLLNTFADYPDAELARLMFHELAHQVVYVADDTAFNESFATAVERLGVAQWLAKHASPESLALYRLHETRRLQFRALTRATREQLAQVYMKNMTSDQTDSVRLAMKNEVMSRFAEAYTQLKAQWGGYSGYDRWVAQANNASFGAQAVYDDWVPGFEALFARQGRDWPRFYAAVRQLAQLPARERGAQLQQWAQEQQLG